jgi:hypothetical protein
MHPRLPYKPCGIMKVTNTFEPCHDKTSIVRLRLAGIKTSLRIRAVWSGSMLFAFSFYTCNRVGKRTALIRPCGCAGWSGSMLVANALCWFCHDEAHFNTLKMKRIKIDLTCSVKIFRTDFTKKRQLN